jgi:hypothetical protein
MAVAERAAGPAAAAGAVTRGSAFGLAVEADFAVPALGAATDAARRTTCRAVTAQELDGACPAEGWTQDVDLRHPDARLFLGIRHHPEAGYRIWAPRHGRHLVSADGTTILSALPQRTQLGWQRLFFAQALPLAAVLHGLEVLHASAVAVDGRAIAFTAASGTGKSSLNAHLVAAGATFLTDDVLALEDGDGGPVAHPGIVRLSVDAHELTSMDRAGRAALGRRAGSSDKVYVEPPAQSGPVPLRALFCLDRGTAFDRVRIREHVPPEPRTVLASSFLPYVRTPARLLNQLATCAAVTDSVRVFDVELPTAGTARAAAEAVLAFIERELSG